MQILTIVKLIKLKKNNTLFLIRKKYFTNGYKKYMTKSMKSRLVFSNCKVMFLQVPY